MLIWLNPVFCYGVSSIRYVCVVLLVVCVWVVCYKLQTGLNPYVLLLCYELHRTDLQVVAQYRRDYPDWYYVRYEDLVTQRGAAFEKLFKYVAVPFTAETRTNVENGFWPRPIDNYKRTLNTAEIAHIKHRTRDVWSQFYTEADW